MKTTTIEHIELMEEQTETQEKMVDKMGIFLSGLCLLDCTALPLLSAFYTFAESIEFLHVILFFVIAPLGITAAVRGYRRHRTPWVTALIISGIGLMAFSAFTHESLHQHLAGFELHTLLSLAASAILITGHWNNLRRLGCTPLACSIPHSH